MLRQQAQEIAMLKQIIDANNLQSDIGQLKKELALQKLSDISQEIENEPVAWMTENGTIFDELPLISGGLIPLYTHPMRELTDEEIEKTWHELYPLDSNNYWEDMRRGCCQLRFARAILKKASEK